MPDLVEGERQVIFPRRHGKDQSKDSVRIARVAGIQVAPPQAAQQVLDLNHGLHRRGRIVDGGREGLDGDIDQKADRVFRVLLEGALPRQVDCAHQFPLLSAVGLHHQYLHPGR